MFFQRSCDVCGRQLRVRLSYMGRKVACPHCGGRFTAKPSVEAAPRVVPPSIAHQAVPPLPSDHDLLARVDALLKETAV